MKIGSCPNCGGKNNFLGEPVGNGDHLKGLGELFSRAPLFQVVCKDCGLVRHFTDDRACSKLGEVSGWRHQHMVELMERQDTEQ